MRQYKRHSTILQVTEFTLESASGKGIDTKEESLVTDNL